MKSSMHTTKKESRFWWHWQNLNEGSHKKLLNGRAWLRHRRTNAELALEWAIPTCLCHIYARFGGENQFNFAFACWLFGFWFHLDGIPLLRRWKPTDDYHAHEIGLSLYAWSLHWRFFTNPDEHHAATPKWREGYFDIPDFLFGRNKSTIVEESPIPVTVALPEGAYPATVTFFSQTWKRPRWPVTKRRDGATIASSQGFPIPGKGESSWDCDDDAYMSVGTSATTVEDAIADVIKRVNERRERYGGKDWLPAVKPKE